MKFFITAILLLFTSLGFSQENLTHSVQKGETLYSISKKYRVPVSQLEQLNPTAKKGLAINSILQISIKKETEVVEHEVIAKETLFGLSKKYNISIEKLKQLNPNIELEGLKIGMVLKVSTSKNNFVSEKVVVEKPKQEKEKKEKVEKRSALQEVFHTVLPKETKYGLSKKYKITIAELEKLNPQIKNELAVGTQLVIQTSQKRDEIQEEVIVPREVKPISVEGLSKIESVIAIAFNNIGIKYRSGGTDSEGFDCSGLMFSTFKTIDITLPRTSAEQALIGVKIDKNSAQKGDLIFFATNNSSNINHVGLITEVSENDIKFVHSSTSSGVIISSIVEEYYDKRFIQINRVIPE